jgi:hypothetical protein
MRPIIIRVFVWALWSIVAGFVCVIVPFAAYGKGVANE